MLRAWLFVTSAMTLWGIATPVSAQSLVVEAACSAYGVTNHNHLNCNNNGTWTTPTRPGTLTYSPGATYTTQIQANGLNGGAVSLSGEASVRSDYGVNSIGTSISLGSNDPNFRIMTGRSYAQWDDRLIIVAPGMLTGAAVRVRVTQLIDITSGPLAAALSGTDAQSAIYSTFSAHGISLAACSEAIAGIYNGSICSAPSFGSTLVAGRNVFTYDFDLRANVANVVSSSLMIEANIVVQYGQSVGGGQASVGGLNTAHTYFTVLTPGATILALSGHNYALPAANGVPEPRTWAILILGLGAVGGAMRRRSAPLGATRVT